MKDAEIAVGCSRCRSTAVKIVREALDEETNGKPFSYVDEFSRCENCGEEFYTPEQSFANSQAYASAEAKADSLLSPGEIRAARHALELTQEQFEDALGVGRKTVVRWERGTVAPSRAANGLLWLAAKYPTVFLEYARERFPEVHAVAAPIIAKIIPATGSDSKPVVILSSKMASHGTLHVGAGTTPKKGDTKAYAGTPQGAIV